MQEFLSASAIIDFDHPVVAAKAAALAKCCVEEITLARNCYYFVRDEIAHSGDIRSDLVTLKASEVLEAGTGWCFAKSHLLCALLRANGIPAALCYQRLQKDGQGAYTLHGLNAVYLPEHGWYRCDARGNKAGVNADFLPPVEHLAWSACDTGEFDFSGRYAEPQSAVIKCLAENNSFQQVFDNLPDATKLES
ncbi:MAG: transglutaminase family protein [Pseudomonadota bacterium]